MLAVGMQVFLHPPHIFAAVGHKHHLLVLLHPLRFHQLPESPAGLLVIGLNEAEAFRWRNGVLLRTAKSHHAPTSDHFEIALFVRRPDVPAVDPHRHGSVRQGLFTRFLRVFENRDSFFAQLLLDPLAVLGSDEWPRTPEHPNDIWRMYPIHMANTQERGIPKRKEKGLLLGDIWVDAKTYRVRQIVGVPLKSPSFWIKDISITVQFADVNGMWIFVSVDAIATVRFLGVFTLTGRDVTPPIATSSAPGP